jgi:hypothetical protein
VGVSPKPWGVPAILVALALPFALWASSLGVAIAGESPDELSQGEIITGLVLTIIMDFVFIGLAAGLSLGRYKLGWDALGLRRFDSELWWLPLGAAAGAYVSIIIYSLVLTSIGADAAAPKQEDLDELFESRAVLPLAGIATVLMAPLAEEVFFRGFIFGGLIRPLGLFGAMAVSGFVFAIFHVTSVETLGVILPFGLIGMLFAWLYYRTGSLWPSVAAHLIFNSVSFIILASSAGSS